MKKGIRAIVFAVALVVFLGSGTVVLGKMQQFEQAKDAYASVEELAGLQDLATLADPAETVPLAEIPDLNLAEETGDENEIPEEEGRGADAESAAERKEEKKALPIPQITMDGLKKLDMDALKAVNPDVQGWILIPGTDISYPLMQADDNEYYLSRTWDKNWNWMGSVFIEAENRNDLSEFNTIIYGHNLRNSSMFSSLRSYSSKKFWKNHPSVYIANESGVYKYNIFAAYEVEVDGHAFWLDITDKKVKKSFLQQSLNASELDTGVEPEEDSRIITLSTCTGAGHETRWVVQAVLETEA